MKSDEMKSCLQEAGDKVAGNASSMAMAPGADYSADVVTGTYVAIGRVHANDEAYRENLTNNSLLKGLSASGLPMNK